MKLPFYTLLLLLSSNSVSGLSSPQCLDEDGTPLDWYIGYKFPKIESSSSNQQSLLTGVRYGILTSLSSSNVNGWKLSPNHIDDSSNSILARTLAQTSHSKHENISIVTYNESPPGGTEEAPIKFAHAKGVLAGDHRQGFWLIHSIPFFGPLYSNHNGSLNINQYEVNYCIYDLFIYSVT